MRLPVHPPFRSDRSSEHTFVRLPRLFVRHPSIRPLELTDPEIQAIVAFMKSTTAPVQSGPLGVDLASTPQRVPSGLVPPGVPTPPGPGPFLMREEDR